MVQASSGQTGATLNEAFLKLFIAQLKNQNPLEPFDASEFTSQLAQLSEVEQLLSLKSDLQVLKETVDSYGLLWAVGLMGKEVLVASKGFCFDGENPVELVLDLPEGTARVGIVVYDNGFRPVAIQELDASGRGRVSVSWDGTGLDGNKAPKGFYLVQVEAFDVKGQRSEAKVYLKGVVTGLERSEGKTYLLLDKLRVSASDLVSVISR